MKITLELPEDVYADYAESIGALSQDKADLNRLVTEAVVRHIAEGVTRARTNRAVMKIQQEAGQAQAGIVTSIKGVTSA